MKRFLIVSSALALLIGNPAQAFNITNLDKIAHTVEIESRGDVRRIVIAPDATEMVPMQVGGTMSIVTPSPKVKKKKGKGAVHSDGLLSGYIGNGRNVGVPIDNDYNYVIWPEGRMGVQGRSRARRSF